MIEANILFQKTTAALIWLYQVTNRAFVWGVRKITPSWTDLGTLLTSATSRAIYVLPIAGYVILYSDYFQQLFKFTSLSPSWGFLSFSARINMIYYGSWVLLTSFALWWWFVPRLLHGKRDLQHFVSDIVVARDRSTAIEVANSAPFTIGATIVERVLGEDDSRSFRDIANELKSRRYLLGDGSGEYEYRIPTGLAFYFKWHNIQRPLLRLFIATLARIGYLLVLLLPSADLLLKVLGTHYHRFFG